MHINEIPINTEFSEVERPYFPLHVAIEKGLVDPQKEKHMDFEDLPESEIAHGRIPNVHHAGLVAVGSELIAFDHTSLVRDGQRIAAFPSSKTDVSYEGELANRGEILCMTLSGRVRIAGFVIDLANDPWRVMDFRQRGFAFMNRKDNLGIFKVSSFDGVPELEVDEVDTKKGVTYLKERKFIRGFGS